MTLTLQVWHQEGHPSCIAVTPRIPKGFPNTVCVYVLPWWRNRRQRRCRHRRLIHRTQRMTATTSDNPTHINVNSVKLPLQCCAPPYSTVQMRSWDYDLSSARPDAREKHLAETEIQNEQDCQFSVGKNFVFCDSKNLFVRADFWKSQSFLQ